MKKLGLAGFLLLLVPSMGLPQEGPSLREVEALLARGDIMEARETLENWWTTYLSMASRTDRQRGIWLRGKLTVDPSLAELDFRRLVLEYPGGPYSDDALFRLGLSAELRGEMREAQASFQSLVRDYPSSPRAVEAQRWIQLHASEIDALPRVAAESAQELPGEGGSSREAGPFSVQLGAFRSLERAHLLRDELRAAGYEPRLVRSPGNGLARVRVGRFSTREPAETLARDLRERGFSVTLVTDADSEEKVGGPPLPGRLRGP